MRLSDFVVWSLFQTRFSLVGRAAVTPKAAVAPIGHVHVRQYDYNNNIIYDIVMAIVIFFDFYDGWKMVPPDDDESCSPRTAHDHQRRRSPPTPPPPESKDLSFELQLRRAAVRLGARVIGRLKTNDNDPSPPTAVIGTTTANENRAATDIDLPIPPPLPPPPPPPAPPLPPSLSPSEQIEVIIINHYLSHVHLVSSPVKKSHWQWKERGWAWYRLKYF